MCTAISLAWSELPTELIGRHRLERRRHDRGEGGEPEVRFLYRDHRPRLPVWRVIAADGTRYYLDPATGELLRSFGASARSYRWLHLGLHRLDFIRGFDRGGGWAAAMTALLGVCLVGIGAGVVLAWRRTRHDLGQLGRRLGQFGRARRRA